jgi:hypothetical protein
MGNCTPRGLPVMFNMEHFNMEQWSTLLFALGDLEWMT